ncbi:hypothetical protein GW764_00925 [Candidatus Parcubacteria bacterium]|nr:hypothetical protein [Candidatus Parcubacteria bacterium]
MSKETWFISPKNEAANNCAMALVDGDNERVTHQQVSEKVPGKEEKVFDEWLIEMNSFEDVTNMKKFSKSKTLKYKVYRKKSPGAKISRWIGDVNTNKKVPSVAPVAG